MEKTAERKTPRDILRIGFRHKRLFFLAASGFATAVLFAAQYWPVKYTGTARFERRLEPAAEQLVGGKSESFESRKLTLKDELVGWQAVERAVEALGLTRDLPRAKDGTLTPEGEMKRQELVRETMKNLDVRWDARSEYVDVVSVEFTHSDPLLAQKLPDTIVHNYFSWVSDQTVKRLSASEEFLKEQVDKANRQCEAANAEIIDLQAKYAGTGLMPDNPGAVDALIQRTQSDIDVVRRQNSVAEMKLARLKELAAGLVSTTAPSTAASTTTASAATAPGATRPAAEPASAPATGPALDDRDVFLLREELRQARDALAAMRTAQGMKDEHPRVQAQQRHVAELERRLQEATSRPAVAPGHVPGNAPVALTGPDIRVELASVQSEVDMTRNELQRLEARLASYKGLMANFKPVRQEYEQKLKKLQDRQVELKRWQDQYLAVQMALQAEVSNRRTRRDLILAAQPQFRPSSPSLLMVLGMALGGGLAFGAALVYLANAMDRSIVTPEDASRAFDLPVLGVISDIVTPRQRRLRRIRNWVVWPAVSGVVLAALAVCGLNVVLWLRYPMMHKAWRQSPANFVVQMVQGRDAARP